MARKVKKRLTAEAKARLTHLADGLAALIDESEQGGTRLVVAPGGRDLIAALRQHVAGRSTPLERMLEMVAPRAGAPGFDTATKLVLLRQYRELRARGLTHEQSAAALRIGKKSVSVDQRTISKWKASDLGTAEEIKARLNARDVRKDS